MTLDGTWTELMFQLASMITLLVSVSKSIENGYRVVSYEKNSYILNKKTKNMVARSLVRTRHWSAGFVISLTSR